MKKMYIVIGLMCVVGLDASDSGGSVAGQLVTATVEHVGLQQPSLMSNVAGWIMQGVMSDGFQNCVVPFVASVAFSQYFEWRIAQVRAAHVQRVAEVEREISAILALYDE